MEEKSKLEILDLARLSGDSWQALEEFDESIKEYHASRQEPGIRCFKEAIRLLIEMMGGIGEPTLGWDPKFKHGGKVAYVLALSAAGSLRSLLASYKLLIAGYFMEAQVSMRMAEQWSEISVIVEANPGLASQVLEEGVQENFLNKARKRSSEFDNLLKAMNKTFKDLSKRGHISRTAIKMITKPIDSETMEFVCAGIGSDEALKKDSLALAELGMNVARVMSRNFRTIPLQWRSRLDLNFRLMEERKR